MDELGKSDEETRILIVVNKLAGTYIVSGLHRVFKQMAKQLLGERKQQRYTYDFLTLKKNKNEEVNCDEKQFRSKLQEAIGRYQYIFVAGGDGTLSSCVSALVLRPPQKTEDIASPTLPTLGIIPVGTGNAIAKELKLPTDWHEALQLLSDMFVLEEKKVDLMNVHIAGAPMSTHPCAHHTADLVALLHVDIGAGSRMIANITPEMKQRHGKYAYVWGTLRTLLGQQPHRFVIRIDDEPPRIVSAMEVVVANAGNLGLGPSQELRWGHGIRMDDAKVDVIIILGRSVVSYFHALWKLLRRKKGEEEDPSHRHIMHFQAHKRVDIDVVRSGDEGCEDVPPVQADGEAVGHLPITINVLPHAVGVLVPKEEPQR